MTYTAIKTRKNHKTDTFNIILVGSLTILLLVTVATASYFKNAQTVTPITDIIN